MLVVPSLILDGKESTTGDRFTYLRTCEVQEGGSAEMRMHVSKTREKYVEVMNLLHLSESLQKMTGHICLSMVPCFAVRVRDRICLLKVLVAWRHLTIDV